MSEPIEFQLTVWVSPVPDLDGRHEVRFSDGHRAFWTVEKLVSKGIFLPDPIEVGTLVEFRSRTAASITSTYRHEVMAIVDHKAWIHCVEPVLAGEWVDQVVHLDSLRKVNR